MRYFSTRDPERSRPCSLREAAFLGLAPDGGLFMPERIPTVDPDAVAAHASASYADLAGYLAGLFFDGDVDPAALREMVRRIYDFPCPLTEAAPGLRTLELFHGPTFAFKDFGARFMGGMAGLLNASDEPLVVLTATSGDTGSAVAAGFHGVPGVRVVVLYPSGKVSPLQESQMTTLGGNIFPVRVETDFDGCQALVKAVFSDREFRKGMRVTSANSINILRWIPQSFYYFYGVWQWQRQTGMTAPDIVVPSGNYGNLSAGMLAARMGLPVRRFVAASNANDVIPAFLRTGRYDPRASVRTLSNAMDVGAPSNYERLMALCDNDFGTLSSQLEGFSCDDAGTRAAIRALYDRYGYVSDPHSAVGYAAYTGCGMEGFWLSTAHSAKFGEVISSTLGTSFPLPAALQEVLGRPKSFLRLEDPSLKALENLMARLA